MPNKKKVKRILSVLGDLFDALLEGKISNKEYKRKVKKLKKEFLKLGLTERESEYSNGILDTLKTKYRQKEKDYMIDMLIEKAKMERIEKINKKIKNYGL